MALQIDSSYLTTLGILGVVLLLTFRCSFAMKGCICVGLANYIGILRRIGGMEVIFRDNPKTQNNLPWYLNSLLELGRRGIGNIISCLHAITPVASTFGLQLDAHLVYSFVLQQGILEYGRALIASSMYTWHYVYFHLVACATAQYQDAHRVAYYRRLLRFMFFIYKLMNISSVIVSLRNGHTCWFFSTLSLECTMVYNNLCTNTYEHGSTSYLLICFVLSFLCGMNYYYSSSRQTYNFPSELFEEYNYKITVTVLLILRHVNFLRQFLSIVQ